MRKTKDKTNNPKGLDADIRNVLDSLASIMVTADADCWAHRLNYFQRDTVNAVIIFQHVCSNVGIKSGHIDEEKAVEFGKRLRHLVIDMTGYDPAAIVEEMKLKEK